MYRHLKSSVRSMVKKLITLKNQKRTMKMVHCTTNSLLGTNSHHPSPECANAMPSSFHYVLVHTTPVRMWLAKAWPPNKHLFYSCFTITLKISHCLFHEIRDSFNLTLLFETNKRMRSNYILNLMCE